METPEDRFYHVEAHMIKGYYDMTLVVNADIDSSMAPVIKIKMQTFIVRTLCHSRQSSYFIAYISVGLNFLFPN